MKIIRNRYSSKLSIKGIVVVIGAEEEENEEEEEERTGYECPLRKTESGRAFTADTDTENI